MNTDLTPEQVASYRENGFVVQHNFLTPEEVEVWRQGVAEAVAQRDDRVLADGSWRTGKNEYYEKVFIQRINLWQDHAGMRKLMFDPRIGKMAATLAGVDGIRIWHDQALIKQPWGNPTAWHLDNPYWSFSSRDSISIWVALDDATVDNGCLYFMPGTQHSADFDNVPIGQNMGSLFEVYPQWASRKTIAAPMKAGSCSFHNGLVAHAAGANMTPGFRRAMTCAYMPDGSTFNGKKNIFSEEDAARFKIGDVIEDDRLVPLIYHPTKPCVSA